MQVAVVHLIERNRYSIVDESDRSGGREGTGALFVDEAGGDHHDEDEGTDVDRSHPEAFAASAPERLAAGGAPGRKVSRLAALHFEQDHQCGQHKNGDEEKEIVADDRADDGHLLAGGGKHAVFRELMQARDYQLESDEEENDGSNTEKFLQIDAHAALDESDAEHHCQCHAQQRPQEAHQFGAVEAHGGEDQHRFHALAQDHEENKGKQSQARALGRQVADFTLDLALQLATGAHHEDDHGDDENGRQQHDPAFEDVLVQIHAREDDGHGDACGGGGAQRNVDGLAQVGAADLVDIGEGDADDERGLHTLAQGDDESFKHGGERPRRR